MAFKAKPKHCRVIHLMAQTHQNIYLVCSQADIDALAMFCAGGFCGAVGKAPVVALGQCLRPSGAPATPPPASVPRAIPHLIPSWVPAFPSIRGGLSWSHQAPSPVGACCQGISCGIRASTSRARECPCLREGHTDRRE